MKRAKLLDLICPSNKIQTCVMDNELCCEDCCTSELNRLLDEYEKQIRTDVIEEIIELLAKSEDTILSDKQYYKIIELKEQKSLKEMLESIEKYVNNCDVSEVKE